MTTLTTRQIAGVDVDVTPDGFLADANQWTPEIAEALAAESEVGALTDRHWQVLTFCREDAAKNGGGAPGLRRISKLSGVGMKELYQLFPKGPGKLAALVAGLPKPKGCI